MSQVCTTLRKGMFNHRVVRQFSHANIHRDFAAYSHNHFARVSTASQLPPIIPTMLCGSSAPGLRFIARRVEGQPVKPG